MAHQTGTGPSSLKLAALSAYSYHLDSPPFTGTAGPLGEHSEDYDRLNSSMKEAASNLEDDDDNNNNHSPDVSGDNTPAAASRTSGLRERIPTSGSSRHSHQSSQVMQEGLDERDEAYHQIQHKEGDVDVPKWHLDDPRHHHQNQNIAQHTNQQDIRSLANDGSSGHVLTNSLSPPPFSSSAQGPLAPSNKSILSPPHRESTHPEDRTPRRRESSRPAFTQISDSNSTSNEDASSAAADGDGDADADADADEEPFEAEVDGDETAYIVRNSTGTINGFTSKVPTQSQTKASKRYDYEQIESHVLSL